MINGLRQTPLIQPFIVHGVFHRIGPSETKQREKKHHLELGRRDVSEATPNLVPIYFPAAFAESGDFADGVRVRALGDFSRWESGNEYPQ